jgi:topoisomerase-4 subunit A
MKIDSFIKNAIFLYGSSVLEDRAFPDAYDGLKPVQRRIIYAMNELGLRPNSKTTKAAKIVGHTMGNYHAHGDGPIFGAAVKMVHSPEPLVDGLDSNWGSMVDPPGAMRYINAKLTEYAYKNFLDPDYLAVTEFAPSYDGATKEPVTLPSKLPNLLINGSISIGVGSSASTPAFTKESVKELVSLALTRKVTTKDCLSLQFKFPFNGECISPKEELLEFFGSGKGSVTLSRTHVIQNNSVLVNGFLYGSWLPLVEKIKGMGVTVSDISSMEHGPQWEIESVDPSILNMLTGRQAYSVGVVVKGTKKVFVQPSIPDFINNWIIWRKKLEQKVVGHKVASLESIVKNKKLLLLAISNLALIIKALQAEDTKSYLMRHLNVNADQADFILNLRVYQLKKLEGREIKILIRELEHKTKTLIRSDVSDLINRGIYEL